MTGAPLARNSLSVSQWTLVSRLTGFVRAVTVAAVLGPTYLGNTYQATNAIPNLLFEMLAGSLLASLLVPSLVSFVDENDAQSVRRVAGGFLGVALAAILVIVATGVLLAPLVTDLLATTVPDPVVAEQQRRVGAILLVLFLPQVALYTVAGTGAAVMNAHGRFALAAAAPALENVGVIATMAAVLVLFGSGLSLAAVGTVELLVLGGGTTAAVGVHALAQWSGARRAGVALVPLANWRDPDVRALVRRATPSLGYAGLNALRVFAATVVANRVAGGVVAYYLAANFFYLPTALGARPIAVAILPRLSRLREVGAMIEFRDEYVRALGNVAFVAIPAAVAYAALAVPLADAASLGELSSARGVELVSAALVGLSLGVVGEGVFVLSTHASYALHDARMPLRAMMVRASVSLAGMAIALSVAAGPALLTGLGLAVACGDLAGAAYLTHRVRRAVPTGTQRLAPAVLRAFGGAAIMIGPASLAAAAVAEAPGGELAGILAVVASGIVGTVTFVAVQRLWNSPELAFFTSAVTTRGAAGGA